jgi:hypothetical protein
MNKFLDNCADVAQQVLPPVMPYLMTAAMFYLGYKAFTKEGHDLPGAKQKSSIVAPALAK